MQHPELTELIEKAAKEAGSKSELARRVGVAPQRLDDWRTGRRSCPPEKVALIASEGNFQPEQWLARATLWKHEGSEDGQRLKKALGKCLRATIAAVVLVSGISVERPALAFHDVYYVYKKNQWPNPSPPARCPPQWLPPNTPQGDATGHPSQTYNPSPPQPRRPKRCLP